MLLKTFKWVHNRRQTIPIYYLDICPERHYDIRLVANCHIHCFWQCRADLEPLGDIFRIQDNTCIHISIASACDFNAIVLWSVWLFMPLYTHMSIYPNDTIHYPYTSITFPSGYNLGSRSSSTPIARKKDVNLWPVWVGGFYKQKILSMRTDNESNYTQDTYIQELAINLERPWRRIPAVHIKSAIFIHALLLVGRRVGNKNA